MFQMILLLLVVIFGVNVCAGDFSPSTTDYDAHGVKMTGNEIMLVEAQNDIGDFFIQFAPYNYTLGSLQCYFDYADSTHYAYSVGIGFKQNSSQAYFFYAGEVVPNAPSTTDSDGNNGTFIGIVINNDPQSAQTYANTGQIFDCTQLEYDQIQFISSYDHQDFYVFGVDPYGQYAIGLTRDFAFIYRPFSSDVLTAKNSSLVWPVNTTFMPLAADTSVLYTIVAGFVANDQNSQVRAIPTVYVISNSNLTVLATWSYTAPSDSWQSRLIYANFETWSNKYTMSVDINFNDSSEILVGMQFLNTVFLFVVNENGTNLQLVSSVDNGYSVGFGKTVTWLSTSQLAILVSTYSFDYVTWYSSQIYLYTSLNNNSLPSAPSAVFPNAQQPLPTTISAQLIRSISTPTSLAILDVVGGMLLILPASPGFYASTDYINSSVAASMPFISHEVICLAGTFKVDTGVYPCFLCPRGSRNPGGIAATSCIQCASTAFCPLGAVVEVDATLLLTQSQSYAYPRSPETDVFDEVLLENMFAIGSTSHCILISPIFWVLIVIGLVLVVLSGMGILKCFVRNNACYRWRTILKRVFRQTDLIGEGEKWVGGLVSLAIIVLVIFAYIFSAAYYNQYPAENVGPSTFACDETIRNAKYQSSLQSLSIPISEEQQPMFDLLDGQQFTLHVDLLNTNASCLTLSVQQVRGSSTVTLNSPCTNENGILSASVNLPYQALTITLTVDDIQLIGAVRVGLSGHENKSGSFELKELDFSQTFYDDSGETLAQTPTINLQLIKSINETEPLVEQESEYSGIWYPTFVVDKYQMFLSENEYFTSANLTSTTLTIVISEALYYIQNIQSPIAKQREIIFHNLLFTIVCLEIFGLIFLVFKLAIFPLLNIIVKYCQKKKDSSLTTSEKVDHEKTANDFNDMDLRF